ncbi:fibronectin type III domain-containing protein [Lactococcus sp. bn62]|uniref:fibronectin type III domain-containing protein n=1 Tax=Lactococcus sp. bn62 TaxID=3037457 RepID=UPI0024C4A44F|nr:fibronectin type III domain-containing protein [Lactococcus sp. bn62]WKY24661.1 fibronectin type III domain-containing protein [Lactococcus sp. bn62]
MADKNYLHTAYANSADGTDGFTTVYPNLNLLTGTSTKVVQATVWNMQVANIKYDKSLGEALCASVMINNADHASALVQGSAKIFLETLDQSGNVLASIFGNNVSYNASGLSWCSISINDNTASVRAFIFTNNMKQNAFYSCLKIEPGSTATPYMPSESEVITADWPKYVGTYVDTNLVSSTDPSKYVWDEMKYRVYLDGVPVGGSKLLSFDLENLKAGTTYNVQVNQINGNVESDKSESAVFKTTLTQ